ncbi:Myc-type, basic helix-loop-helix (bHLH) domain containing protein [Parasponia andersonii]|uniref:Myc-type, basic helix-loop-helix (BHLH) domain containing protein n=1 Tax=Parasponia andersonii TaxID=3476 RepID=A0A2P5BP32_PARAD|nr:Myc-type, basic helix-loop-helix (bHLH) domain containing protein [Parasponia andersonii]
MNRAGVLQSSPVQQMMAAGNPNWWNINAMRPPTQPVLPSPSFLYPQFIPTTTTTTTATTTTTTTSNSSSSSSANSSHHELPNIPSWAHDNNQDQLPESWSQLLLGGLAVGEEEKANNMMSHFQVKKLENWEDHHPHYHQQMLSSTTQASNASVHMVDHVKQENSAAYVYGHGSQEFQAKPGGGGCGAWLSHQHQIMMANNSNSSPKSSCVTSFSSNMLDFSNISKADHHTTTHPPLLSDRSSECNSTATGGAPLKKARVQPSSAQNTFKVRKEKLGDRITSLHQLVSPFGKTDTASVLLEAIGYIRFLQSQIEALSLPYLGSGSGNMRQQQSVHGERNCMFPEDPGQLLNDNCMKRKGAPDQQDSLEEPKKDLRSRGLCLVPVSCTLQVGSDNGADYWAPALGGGTGGGF